MTSTGPEPRARRQRRAGFVVLVMIAAILLQNGFVLVRNQTLLQEDATDEIDEWFEVKDRDIERVAKDNPRFTVSGWIAIYYFLGERIGGKTLTIPDWWEWSRWELEHVARLQIEVAPPTVITGFQARRLRRVGETHKRMMQQGAVRRGRRLRPLMVIADEGEERYVMVESDETKELFVISEKRLAHVLTLEAPGK